VSFWANFPPFRLLGEESVESGHNFAQNDTNVRRASRAALFHLVEPVS
jgi:hypothetical protein